MHLTEAFGKFQSGTREAGRAIVTQGLSFMEEIGLGE